LAGLGARADLEALLEAALPRDPQFGEELPDKPAQRSDGER
jgi:hypothetical protein